MKTLGLIGKTLKHSFSKKYFTEKFAREGIEGFTYELFELESIDRIEALLSRKDIAGLNVTIPYKTQVIPYLNSLATSAERMGAVNVIAREGTGWKGHNSDYTGFRDSLTAWLPGGPRKALVLGSGGASKAVTAVLEDLSIPYTLVSRRPGEGRLTYEQLDAAMIGEHHLLINTTPLGMYPDVHSQPPLPYNGIGEKHFLYDLVYNPEVTAFLREGLLRGARTKGGLDMLYLQAEKAWQIWNQTS